DVNALRRPGTPIQDAQLPVGIVYGSLGVGGGGPTIEAFYQFQWQPSVFEGCGTYWSTIDAQGGPNTASSGCPAAAIPAPHSVGYPAQMFVPVAPTHKASNGGQFGIAVRQKVLNADTELGFYAMNIHSRVPVLDGIRGVVTFQANANATGLPNPKGAWDYPKNFQVYGVSASTKLAGWSIGTELSVANNVPVQISVGDLIASLLYPTVGV